MLNKIIEEIKFINDKRLSQQRDVISEDTSNEEISRILNRHALIDDDDLLSEKFGSEGLNAIRDAEQGIY